MTEPPRRFPPPWQIVEHREAFEIQDATGQNLAWLYFEEEPGRRRQLKRLTKDEARRIARGIVRLPELMRGATDAGSPKAPLSGV